MCECFSGLVLCEWLQKIKELTYLHSEGILSGEIKHGPLAMIDDEMSVIMIITKDNVYTVNGWDNQGSDVGMTWLCCVVLLQKCLNALAQVSARAVSGDLRKSL